MGNATLQLLNLANQQHLAGDLGKARETYDQVLQLDPANARALFGLGLIELQNAQPVAALEKIQQAISLDPHETRYQFGLGQTLAALNQFPEAQAAYQKVLATNPNSPDVYFSIGVAQQHQKNWPGAIASYQSAIQLQPDYIDALNNLGNCHQRQGDLAKAEAIYRQALALNPASAAAQANLALLLAASGKPDEALRHLQAAIDQEPTVATHYLNLGALLHQQRRFNHAVQALRRAIELDPNSSDAFYNLGNALKDLGQLRKATDQYRRAIELRSDFADAHNNSGTVYKQLGEFSFAADSYAKALRCNPRLISAYNNAANLHRVLGRLDEAEALLRQALTIDPKISATHNNLGSVLRDVGEIEEALRCYRQAITLDPQNSDAHSNLAYAIYFHSASGREILEECRRWDERHGAKPQAAPTLALPRGTRGGDMRKRLRIGYVSPDFRDHCQSFFTIPLLSNHDHQSFEIFCYSSVERPDAITQRIKQFADVWREAGHLSDSELSDLIQSDQIDILIDLTMHMAGGRSKLFTRKPAPIQAAWLAYPGTTGLCAMDYAITDPYLTPAEFESHYAEKVLRLPNTFWCYDPLIEEPPINALPALSAGYVTFGCLNAPCKLSDHTLQLWGEVMQRVQSSRLMLMAPQSNHRQTLLNRLGKFGVPADRVFIQSFQPRQMYLRSYHQIDLGLDTIPYNGHTTSLDSYWMGVPVVSRIGGTAVGRAGLSQLTNLNLGELAADSDEKFVEIVVELASDLSRLTDLRSSLRQRMQSSPLMNGKRFAQNMEDLYRQMHSAAPHLHQVTSR